VASGEPHIEESASLQIRLVRPSELGAKLARTPISETPRPAPPARPMSPPTAAPQRPAAAPESAARSHTVPVARRSAAPSAPLSTRATLVPTTTARAVSAEEPAPRRLVTSGRVFSVFVCALLYVGLTTPTERYISPNRGLGYALGIIGGSLMLLLLVYSLRKRWTWLAFLGPTPSWFRFHMVLGVLGPLCILYHANFSTGAANSNVALFCMLIVAGSGLVGRYIYARIHHGLYGRKLELGELRASAAGLHSNTRTIQFLPELATRLDAAEQRLLRTGPRLSVLGFTKPVLVAIVAVFTRWQLHGYARRALRQSARNSAVIAAERQRLRTSAHAYIDRRLAATRRVAAFEGYERLFSLWHALHIPLIFMMIIAAIIHVIAVHVY
jgi:hypothetical protein